MLALHKASVRAQCAGHYSLAHIDAWFHDRTPEIYRPALEGGRVWLAETSGQILGFASAEPGEVTLLFVNPGHAGRGIGKLLFEHALTRAAAEHQGPLTVVATLNSVSFYERYGFGPVADDAFIRGEGSLRYPVKRMVQQRLRQGPHASAATDA
jgi:GNAT superfamily N-acetyltransferase